MGDYFEFSVRIDCPHCTWKNTKYDEFHIGNRTQFICNEWSECECEKCDKTFQYKASLEVSTMCEETKP